MQTLKMSWNCKGCSKESENFHISWFIYFAWDDESILKKAMMFEVNGPRKRGRPKQTWKKQVEENM